MVTQVVEKQKVLEFACLVARSHLVDLIESGLSRLCYLHQDTSKSLSLCARVLTSDIDYVIYNASCFCSNKSERILAEANYITFISTTKTTTQH